MSNISEVLPQVGFNFIVKVVRIAVGAACYGVYVLLMSFSTTILCRKGVRSKGVLFLLFVTLVMFAASSLFLAMDIADMVERLQIVLIDNPNQTFQEKQGHAETKVEIFVWIGEMLFIFMLALGDSIVLWRTWTLYHDNKIFVILPFLTWLGSVATAFYELGCDIQTGWSLSDTNPSAGSLGSKSCAKADTASFTLSYSTNIICTLLIFLRAWQHRRSMMHFLGSARRKTQAERIMALLVESGAFYIALYTFQAIPIYGGSFRSGSLIAVEAVNAIIQQAMGMYPTAIVVLVEMQKSLWDTTEVSREVSDMRFTSASPYDTRASRAVDNSGHNARHTVAVNSAGNTSSNLSVNQNKAVGLLGESGTPQV